MKKVEHSPAQKAHFVSKVKTYFTEELDEEIGQFDAEFLLDFFGDLLGGAYYNQGLQDALGVIESQTDRMKETLFAMEETV